MLRPVKRLQNKKKNMITADNFLPCKYCLGFYNKRSLYRHTKICSSNFDGIKKRQTSQSDGQTALLLCSMKHDELLNTKIFSRIRADAIGLIVKKDPLICKFGYSHLKGKHTRGNLDLVRQNMRRLAKLLQFGQKQNSGIVQLTDMLRPCHFQLIIEGVHNLAKYNLENNIYKIPAMALNFGKLIEKCCDLAYIDLIQVEKCNDQTKDLKVLKRLVASKWPYEIAAQAGINLSQNTSNKNELPSTKN